jgi:hypothetical protein
MVLLVPDVGEVELLDKLLKDALSVDENYTLKLFKNDITPAEGDVAGTYTEADFTGYVAKTLTRAGWAAASTLAGVTSTTFAQQSWSPTSAQTVYGYYVIGATSTVLLWAERFASPRALVSGDTLQLTPRMELD